MAHDRRNLMLAVPIAVLALAPLDGCSRSDGRQAASGMVTLDGQPLAGQGMINFRPAEGNDGNSSGATLTRDGSFLIAADQGLNPGKYTVTIRLWKDTGRTRQDPNSGEVFPIMAPVRFKEAGQLDALVTNHGPNRFEFHLTSVHDSTTTKK